MPTCSRSPIAPPNRRPVVDSMNDVDPRVLQALSAEIQQRFIADRLGQADVVIRFGTMAKDGETLRFVPADSPPTHIPLEASPEPGQTQERTVAVQECLPGRDRTCSRPMRSRSRCRTRTRSGRPPSANVTGLLAAIALFALALSVLVSSAMARRFTTPLRRLDRGVSRPGRRRPDRRVEENEVRSGSSELAELAVQFNTMADRLQESVEIIRRDRDRSRDFLADVSHELRTPLAALRMFNELLEGGAADDPEARAEFLESSGQQIERLDWLAQNLLELSKLDSGLGPARPPARRSPGGGGERSRPDGRRRHPPRRGACRSGCRSSPDPHPPRPATDRPGGRQSRRERGQVHAAGRLDHGGRRARRAEGARIDVADTGVGIDAAELPHIFERFYRGSRANEARGSGSGLGLAIVRSIVDMHGGTVVVESQVGVGSRFIVDLPGDPRLVAGNASG